MFGIFHLIYWHDPSAENTFIWCQRTGERSLIGLSIWERSGALTVWLNCRIWVINTYMLGSLLYLPPWQVEMSNISILYLSMYNSVRRHKVTELSEVFSNAEIPSVIKQIGTNLWNKHVIVAQIFYSSLHLSVICFNNKMKAVPLCISVLMKRVWYEYFSDLLRMIFWVLTQGFQHRFVGLLD